MSIDALSEMLWRERRLLELLLFKLEEEQLVLAAGRNRWLAHATRELETVFEEINVVELERAVTVNPAARWLGLGPDATLREMAEAAPVPWNRLLLRHRDALVALAEEIDAVAEANHELLDTQEAVAEAGGAGTRDADAGFEGAEQAPLAGVPDNVFQLQLQRVARDAAPGATRAVQPSLLEFLR
ncbi:MAG: flagellar export chaperone FlgN [Acidimicrobiia bacterium]